MCVYVARENEEDENEGHSKPSVSDKDEDDNLHNDDDNHFGGDQVLLQSLDTSHTFEIHQTTLEFEMRPPHEHTTIRPPPQRAKARGRDYIQTRNERVSRVETTWLR